jgi:hypothetical protein
VLALDRNGVELVVIYRDVGVLGVFVAPAPGLALNRLARDLVDSCWRRRLPVFLLICRNDTRSAADVPV